MGFLSGKRILITGVASKLSIAYGIAQAMHRAKARNWHSPIRMRNLKGRVEEFAAALGSDIVLPCDVAEDESITALFTELEKSGQNSMVSSTQSVLPPADQLGRRLR
ncbi:SDR family oxidoreductase [Klebsiella pneumoniae subsp. pneumoniae]|nr:SDR family oxidoreductase [Klebsiella pneumoniae subsp. pneumoniae]